MERNMQWDCLFRGLDWFMGLVAVLMLLSVGLELSTLQIQEQADGLRALFLLYLSAWIGAVGLACLAVILMLLLVREKMSCR